MIAGLCESPLTFQAITIWRDELLDEAIMLRDVIDLETTFSGQMETDEVESVLSGLKTAPEAPAAPPAAAPAAATPPRPEPAPRAAAADEDDAADEDEEDETPPAPDPDEDEDDDQGNLSLAAMEAALKPQVLETLERIANDYVRLAEMQDDRISATLNRNESSPPARSATTSGCAARSSSWSTRCTCTTTASRRWSTSSTASTARS